MSPKVIYPSPTSPELEDYEDRPLTAELSDGLKDALAKYKESQLEDARWDLDDDEPFTRRTKRPDTIETKRKRIKVEQDPSCLATFQKSNPNKTKRPNDADTPNKKPKIINARVTAKKL
jgi:hypothetical protein